MKFSRYLKDKAISLVMIAAAAVFTAIYLILMDIPVYTAILPVLVIVLCGLIALLAGYVKKIEYFRDVLLAFDKLADEDKYLLYQEMPRGRTMDSEIYHALVASAGLAMESRVAEYRKLSEGYRKAIEEAVQNMAAGYEADSKKK